MNQAAKAVAVRANIEGHLDVLVNQIGARPPGSEANRRATDYVLNVLSGAGWQVRQQSFDCKVWYPGTARIVAMGQPMALEPPPFSRPCDVEGRLARITSAAAASERCLADRVVLLDGELAGQAIFPKRFPFLSFPDQQRLIEALEGGEPLAVLIAATGEGPLSPLLEDGDLKFPYATIPASIALRLADGDVVGFSNTGRVEESQGVNPSGRSGGQEPVIVLSAHVDSKATTPGAFDNASGVAVLLSLAQLGLPGGPCVELVFFNGEDHYAAPGEQAWLAATDLRGIQLAINLDGVGAVGRPTSVSFLSATPEVEGAVADVMRGHDELEPGQPWFESDHAIFAQAGIPSVAITSSGAHELLDAIAHGPADKSDQVDPTALSRLTMFLEECLARCLA